MQLHSNRSTHSVRTVSFGFVKKYSFCESHSVNEVVNFKSIIEYTYQSEQMRKNQEEKLSIRTWGSVTEKFSFINIMNSTK